MHELGIVFHIIDEVKKVAEENGVSRINSVTLDIGEVSTVVPVYLMDLWKWAVEREEVTKGCKLKYNLIKAVTYCEDCQKTYSTVEHAKVCPHCGSEHTYLLEGNQVSIKEIEVQD